MSRLSLPLSLQIGAGQNKQTNKAANKPRSRRSLEVWYCRAFFIPFLSTERQAQRGTVYALRLHRRAFVTRERKTRWAQPAVKVICGPSPRPVKHLKWKRLYDTRKANLISALCPMLTDGPRRRDEESSLKQPIFLSHLTALFTEVCLKVKYLK